MRKRQTIKILLILAFFPILIFSFTYFGASAFSSRLAVNQEFPERTFLGTVDISAKSYDEAKLELEERISAWKSSAKITLAYKGQQYSLHPSHFNFLIDKSINAAVPGTRNELLIELDGQVLDGLSLPPDLLASLDKDGLEKELLEAGRNFIPDAEVSLENYLPKEEAVVISAANIQLPEEMQEVKEFVEAFPTIELAPESQFSFAGFAESSGFADRSSYTYSLIASTIYKAILPTNFIISERHISSKLPDNIEPGFEAKVDFQKKIDLMFYNPNTYPYSMEFTWNESGLAVSIIGVPLLYEYSVAASDKQEFKPRTIRQYSPLISPGQKTVEREGEPGVLVRVEREIFSRDGELLKTEAVSEDFYHPIHKIEIFPLATAIQQTSHSEEPGSAAMPEDGQVDYPGNEMPVEDSGGNNDSVSDDLTGDIQDGTDEAYEDDGGLWGKPNEQPK